MTTLYTCRYAGVSLAQWVSGRQYLDAIRATTYPIGKKADVTTVTTPAVCYTVEVVEHEITGEAGQLAQTRAWLMPDGSKQLQLKAADYRPGDTVEVRA